MSDSVIEPCTRVRVKTKTGTLIAEGDVSFDDGRFASVLVGSADIGVVYDRRFFVIEAEEPAPQQSIGGDDAAVISAPTQGEDPGGEPVEPAPLAPPRPKNNLNDDDVERLLTRLGDTALAGLKGIGLKSGAIYPLMIKINDAIKAALSSK